MTSNEEDNRLAVRLEHLRHKPTLETKTDDFLIMCIDESLAFFLDYTNRSEDPGKAVDMLICELATLKAQSEGVEHVASATEGGISRSWYAEIPPFLLNRLRNWRLIRGLQG